MKRKLSIVCIAMIMLLVGCGKNEAVTNHNGDSKITGKKILIAYFTFPETEGVDASSSASRVILDDKIVGSTEYMAKIIQENTSGDLFTIATVQEYPGVHEPLVDQASREKETSARPDLKEEIKNFTDYDTIFIGYPNWWGDMPMPLYSFLEEYNFSGKTIIPFNTHGGSGFSNTIETIAELESSATVIKTGLSISRNDVNESKNEIVNWLNNLGLKK